MAVGDEHPSLLPRNLKQVYNLQQKINQEQRHDDIYELYRFSKEHPGYIPRISLMPDFLFVQVNPDISKHINAISSKENNLVYYYDTTFNIGPVYTSILSLGHPLFKGNPIIPVAVLFHESANTNCHREFFQTLKTIIPLDSINSTIVTDREQAMKNAINEIMPNVNHVYCWNHLIRVSFRQIN